MGRRIGPSCKLCRREGVKLFLKGIRCTGDKCAIERNNVPPGMHGAKGARRKMSDYYLQLREKQKAKRIYGMLEKQFRVFFARALKTRGITGEKLVEMLERRLDNVVYRLLFVTSRPESRLFVRHGHVVVNGKKVSIPSFQVKVGDLVEISAKETARKRITANLEMFKDRNVPEWLELDRKKLSGRIIRLPHREESGLPVEEQQIVELYSK
jgi:small subunit ribosomal protein S4